MLMLLSGGGFGEGGRCALRLFVFVVQGTLSSSSDLSRATSVSDVHSESHTHHISAPTYYVRVLAGVRLSVRRAACSSVRVVECAGFRRSCCRVLCNVSSLPCRPAARATYQDTPLLAYEFAGLCLRFYVWLRRACDATFSWSVGCGASVGLRVLSSCAASRSCTWRGSRAVSYIWTCECASALYVLLSLGQVCDGVLCTCACGTFACVVEWSVLLSARGVCVVFVRCRVELLLLGQFPCVSASMLLHLHECSLSTYGFKTPEASPSSHYVRHGLLLSLCSLRTMRYVSAFS